MVLEKPLANSLNCKENIALASIMGLRVALLGQRPRRASQGCPSTVNTSIDLLPSALCIAEIPYTFLTRIWNREELSGWFQIMTYKQRSGNYRF